jgi:MFS transporter, ACS family, solute carrier family 17 (sodium-dependent inorganic phosphate cotransporter), other
MTALFTLLTPLAAKTNFYLLIVVRVVEGIFEGVTFPCIADVWSKWAPPLERSKMAGFALAGNYVGTVIAFPLSGVFSKYFGWESVFYIFGCIGVLWFVVWFAVVKRSPQEDRKISEEEKNYIVKSLGVGSDRKEVNFSEVPWKSIWSSPAVWAFMVAHFCESWGFFTMLTELPSFMKGYLRFL